MIQPDPVSPITTDILLPGIQPVNRPRIETFRLLQNVPHRIATTILKDFIVGSGLDLTALDVQAKVFRNFNDPDTVISHKTRANGGIIDDGLSSGQIEIQLEKIDVAEAQPIYVAIYINGSLLDLFYNEIHPTPVR